MNHRLLREIAKVAVGLFIADILCAVWLGSTGLLPLSMLGVMWTTASIMPGIVFDLVVILLLAHLAWNTHLPVRPPSEKGLLTFVGFAFLAVAFLHLLRLVFGWALVLGAIDVPLWLSWAGVFVAAYLSYSSFRFAFRAH